MQNFFSVGEGELFYLDSVISGRDYAQAGGGGGGGGGESHPVPPPPPPVYIPGWPLLVHSMSTLYLRFITLCSWLIQSQVHVVPAFMQNFSVIFINLL